jgi:hypothetical protein
MVEAANTSKTSVNFHQTTRRNNPENSHLHTRCSQNLKSHMNTLCRRSAELFIIAAGGIYSYQCVVNR